MKTKIFLLFVLTVTVSAGALAQTTRFTFQGRLTDQGNPAEGSYLLRFRMFDAQSGGTQIGSTLDDVTVNASQGVFSAVLDFGTPPFAGADRYLEISVRRSAAESYVTLSPREQITSSPYSVKAISATQADVALDAQKLGGVNASEYVTSTTGGTSFIRNQTTQQPASNFNISGDGAATRMFVGAPTALPGSAKLVVNSGGYGITHHNNTVAIQSLINSETGYVGTTSSHPFGILAGGTERMWIGTNGSVGIGTNAPTHTLDVNGFIRAYNVAGGNVVSETTGGVNSWARLWLRTPVQTWAIGSSNTFNGNQLYISNENPTGGGIRMAIMPNGFVGIGTSNPQAGLEVAGTSVQQRVTDFTSGNSLVLQGGAGSNMKVTGYNYGTGQAVPLYLSVDGANTVLNSGGGNVLQPGSGYGMPKAMLYVNGDGTMIRCYNGLTGSTSGSCGYTTSRGTSGLYSLGGLPLSGRFVSVSLQSGTTQPVGISYEFSSPNLSVRVFETNSFNGVNYPGTDRPFTVIIY